MLTKKMSDNSMKSLSMTQEPNTVKNYYNRTRGNIQAKMKEEELSRALGSLKKRVGYKTEVPSPLNPKSEINTRNRQTRQTRQTKLLHKNANKEEIPEYLRNLPPKLLSQALAILRGRGRTRRHRATRRR
jgi:hypothetical protein